MRKFINRLKFWYSDRNHRRMDKYNLKEANSMGDDCLEEDAWLYGLVWDEKKGKYKRSKTAFSDGLKNLEQCDKQKNKKH